MHVAYFVAYVIHEAAFRTNTVNQNQFIVYLRRIALYLYINIINYCKGLGFMVNKPFQECA